jgi:hypothetical protein
MKFFSIIRKQLLLYLLMISVFISTNCSKDRSNEELAGLYLLLIQNPGETDSVSIIDIEVRDVGSYEGKCMDQFIGINASSYYNVHYPPEIRNQPTRKAVLSKELCRRLGFSGGVENRLDGRAVSMRSYFCNAQTSLCSSKAIEKVGF